MTGLESDLRRLFVRIVAAIVAKLRTLDPKHKAGICTFIPAPLYAQQQAEHDRSTVFGFWDHTLLLYVHIAAVASSSRP